jgi:hypothetical protein
MAPRLCCAPCQVRFKVSDVQLGNGNLAFDDLGAPPAALVVESHPAALAFAVVPVLVELEVDEQAVRFETRSTSPAISSSGALSSANEVLILLRVYPLPAWQRVLAKSRFFLQTHASH